MSTPRKTKLPWWIAAGVTILGLVSAVVSGVSSQDGFLQYLIDIAPLVVFLWIAAWMATRLASWVELKDWPTVVAYTLPSIVIVFFPYWSPVRYRINSRGQVLGFNIRKRLGGRSQSFKGCVVASRRGRLTTCASAFGRCG